MENSWVVNTDLPREKVASLLGLKLIKVNPLCSDLVPNRNRSISKDEIAQVKELCKKGITLHNIARTMHRDRKHLVKLCKRLKIKYSIKKDTVSKESVDKLISFLKTTKMTAKQVSEIFPEFNTRKIGYYRAKYNIHRPRAGGFHTANGVELKVLKEYAANGHTYQEIADMMANRFKKPMTREGVRGRFRVYKIPYCAEQHENIWKDSEIKILKQLYADVGFDKYTLSFYMEKLQPRTYGSIRHKLRELQKNGGI